MPTPRIDWAARRAQWKRCPFCGASDIKIDLLEFYRDVRSKWMTKFHCSTCHWGTWVFRKTEAGATKALLRKLLEVRGRFWLGLSASDYRAITTDWEATNRWRVDLIEKEDQKVLSHCEKVFLRKLNRLADAQIDLYGITYLDTEYVASLQEPPPNE